MLNMIFLACLILTILPGEAAQKCSGIQAKYSLSFIATWSSVTHPGTGFPSNGHFSPLIGASHNSNYKMWAPGLLASPGVKSVAETGKRTTLERELKISDKTVLKVIKGPSETLSSPGNLTVHEVSVSDQYPLVSVITMIAPSPDWILGVHDLNLCDVVGQTFKDRVSFKLFVYDSGTDSGTNFTSPNSVTSPPMKIFRITKDMDTPFKSNSTIPPLGFMVFTKIEENKTTAPTVMPNSPTQPMTGNQTTPTVIPNLETQPMTGNQSTPTAMPTSPTEPMTGNQTAPKSKAANSFTMDVVFTCLLLLVLALTF